MTEMTGAEAIIKTLKKYGIDTIFGLPGIQLDHMFDALYHEDSIRVIHTRHEQGALARVHNVLAAHELNLTKLESRPRPGQLWEYRFYIDFEGNAALPAVTSALEDLKAHVSFLKVLGSYPQANRQGTGEVAPARLEAAPAEA